MYTAESYTKPFWAENSGFMTGRDPLGVQNSSITAYGKLLPGMTNLTLRMRYYGFYMWVLDEFFKKQGSNKEFTQREQFNYIRRAELIIAYLMHVRDPIQQSIIGSDFTNRHTNDIEEHGYFDIILGADKLPVTVKGSVYWDYVSGALGQYYAGALSNLKLISVDNKFFTLEDKGKELAKAFRASISAEQEKLFLQKIEDGKLTLADIEQLGDFAIDQIKPGSAEWDFYIQLLLEADGDGVMDAEKKITFMRKGTIQLLLAYHAKPDEGYNDRSFILNEYLKNVNALEGNASFGWYYYYVNEVFHFALESVFWGILVELDGKPMAVNDFLKLIHDEIIENSDFEAIESVEDVMLQMEDKQVHEVLEELEQLAKSTVNNKLVLWRAIEVMLLNYLSIEDHIDQFDEFERRYFITGQKGRVTENFQLYVKNNLQHTLSQFVQKLVQQLLNDHVNTAYRKMGNGESNLLKFIVEDGVISHIQTMPPKHTSPRLRTITNFMRDLSLIDSENLITAQGKEVLNRISA